MTKSFLLHSPTYSLQGIEGAAESLEQLWISYNQIDRMKPIRALQRLKVLYMSHNYVREWREFDHMAELPALEDLVFIGNPLEEETSNSGKYTDEVIKRLLYLKKLDGYPVIREREDNDDDEVRSTLDAEEIENMARYYFKSILCSEILINFTYISENMLMRKMKMNKVKKKRRKMVKKVMN